MKSLLLITSAIFLLASPVMAQDEWPQPSWLDQPVPNDPPSAPITQPRSPQLAANDLPLLQEQQINAYPAAQPVQPVNQYPAPQYPIGAYSDASPQYIEPAASPSSKRASTDDILFSGNISAVTDYSHRGISRSDGPALQGTAKLGYNGVYGGASASTVDLNADSDANFETVLFGGYQGVFDGLDYDARLAYSAYPGSDNDDLDYLEFILTGGYDFDAFYGALTWAASPNYMNDSGMSLYYGADLSAPFTISNMDLTASAHLGFLFVDDEANYAEDPTDWSLGLNYKEPTYGVDLGVSYVGTDLDDNECIEECGSRMLLSAGKSLAW